MELGANLLVQMDISAYEPSRHLIGIPDPDDLADAYRRIRDHIQCLRQQEAGCRIIGDYTGGTKTMSAALAMACVEEGVEVGVVKGQRTNLQKVDQSEATQLMDIAPLHATHRLHSQLRPILDLHNYGEALHLVSQFREIHGQRLSPLSAENLAQLSIALSILEAWDQFQWNASLEHAGASQLVTHCPALTAWWDRVVKAGHSLGAQKPWQEIPAGITGYELVQDLILSAERRGSRGWYDDAVARLYRALELLAETYISLELRLKPTGEFDPDRRCFQFLNDEGARVDGPSAKGVSNLYLWIRGYEKRQQRQNGLGDIFSERKKRFERLMNARNKSLLAHGLRPLSRDRWLKLQSDISFFVDEMLASQGITQGPSPHQLPSAEVLSLPAAQQLFGPAALRVPATADLVDRTSEG